MNVAVDVMQVLPEPSVKWLSLLHTHGAKEQWERSVVLLQQLRSGEVCQPEGIASTMEKLCGIQQGTSGGLLSFLQLDEAHKMVRAIAALALEAPRMFPETDMNVTILQQGSTHTVQLCQRQIACLVALGFFGLVPSAVGMKLRNEGRLRFDRWFPDNAGREQLFCLFNYFGRCSSRFLDDADKMGRTVKIRRKIVSEMDLAAWVGSHATLQPVSVHGPTDRIEDAGSGCIQVDFANISIGGGVLGGGKSQEEIRFLICPELFATIVLCASMHPTEAIEISGVEQYSQYTGYSRSFRYAGDFVDCTDGARVVAIDAVPGAMESQYSKHLLARELNKARAGFAHSQDDAHGQELGAVATGNWGCGVFGADVHMKSLIQWAAASIVGRTVSYYPFDSHVAPDLPVVVSKMRLSQYNSVGHLCYMLSRYHHDRCVSLHAQLANPQLDYHGAGIDDDVERYESVFEFVLRAVTCKDMYSRNALRFIEPQHKVYSCAVQ